VPEPEARFLGLSPGARVRIAVENDRVVVLPNIHELARLYIEPTSACNLSCTTCVRNTWAESMGHMDITVFDRLVDRISDFEYLESVMLAGHGEPTFHPDILYMVRTLKSAGLKVEITTNGTLLDGRVLADLVENGLDTLWVSFDGTRPDTYDSVRGASFERLVTTLKVFNEVNLAAGSPLTVGIAFVVTKENVGNLADLTHLAQRVGARMVSVSNILPYSRPMLGQMVCRMALTESRLDRVPNSVSLNIPRLDVTPATKDPIYGLLRSNKNVTLLGRPAMPDTPACRFIRERCTFVRWDGVVSPCMGLLHSHDAYRSPSQAPRRVSSYSLGNVTEHTLKEIWESPEYYDFREKVDAFDFSPCAVCGGCDYSETNDEDCFGNKFPTCGGCLWAQGVIQCP
jgi:MoaA/NifB/PqqE/SkfB family radical SAM enzyme